LSEIAKLKEENERVKKYNDEVISINHDFQIKNKELMEALKELLQDFDLTAKRETIESLLKSLPNKEA